MGKTKKKHSYQPSRPPLSKRWCPRPLMAPDEELPVLRLYGEPAQPPLPDPNYKYNIACHVIKMDIDKADNSGPFDFDSEESPLDYGWVKEKIKRDAAEKEEKEKEKEAKRIAALEEAERRAKGPLQEIPPFRGDREEEARIRAIGFVPQPMYEYWDETDPDEEKWLEQVRKDKVRAEDEKMEKVAEKAKIVSKEWSGSEAPRNTQRDSSAPPKFPEKRFIPDTSHVMPKPKYDRDTTPYTHGIYLDTTDPLNAPLKKKEFINTEVTAFKILREMEENGISQTEFAKNVIDRRQDTLASLLNRPWPFNEIIYAHKVTYIRMYRWLQMPKEERVNFAKGVQPMPMLKPVVPVESPPAFKMPSSSVPSQKRLEMPKEERVNLAKELVPMPMPKPVVPIESPPTFEMPSSSAPSQEKRRLVLTDHHHKVLSEAFKKNQRPPKQVLNELAKQLELKVGQVTNYFMNRRHRGLGKKFQ